jgi:hypothetical protein
MKQAFKDIGIFLIGLVLVIVSLILSPILIIWGVIESLIYAFWKRSIGFALRFLGGFLLATAIGIDMLLNIVIQVPANRMLCSSVGYKFGKPGDTFSKALGQNLLKGTFRNKFGINICKFLSFFDKDHCKKSI